MLILLLFFLEILFVLGLLNIISWNLVLAFSVMYLFINGLIIELKEIKIKEDLKAKIAEKLEKIEKSIIGSKEKIESDERVKQRLSAKKREIIEWLNKL
ncbi:MAG: hypothetical protein QXK49_03120 [Candidatus Aenigmatarchaeota archaeon]